MMGVSYTAREAVDLWGLGEVDECATSRRFVLEALRPFEDATSVLLEGAGDAVRGPRGPRGRPDIVIPAAATR